MFEELPMPYRLIILMCLVWGMWSAGMYLLLQPETRLEILAEYKDTVVFDSKRELPIIFSTD
ncbi:MAG: hypothetical protein ACUZ8I_14295 [Candidatus Scalindua sp.]